MKLKLSDLDETRLRAIFKQAQYNQTIPPEDRIKIVLNHLESLRTLRQRARRVEPNEKI
ncbi:MAG: hypothetical protein ACFFBD_14445 [Candidatus Hodarchaeota archaeon]